MTVGGSALRRGGTVLAAAVALAGLACATAVGAGEQLDRYLFNSNARDLTRAIDQTNEARDALRAAPDNATGCRLVRDVVRGLGRIADLARRQADLARNLGERNAFDTASEMRDLAERERAFHADGLVQQCAAIGL